MPQSWVLKKIIIQNFYARLSHDDQWLLNTACNGSFMKKTIDFRWDLLEIIKCNTENWELEKGKESGIKLKFDCVKSFMNTDAFQKFSTNMDLTLR